jgi:hypothetical protein
MEARNSKAGIVVTSIEVRRGTFDLTEGAYTVIEKANRLPAVPCDLTQRIDGNIPTIGVRRALLAYRELLMLWLSLQQWWLDLTNTFHVAIARLKRSRKDLDALAHESLIFIGRQKDTEV